MIETITTKLSLFEDWKEEKGLSKLTQALELGLLTLSTGSACCIAFEAWHDSSIAHIAQAIFLIIPLSHIGLHGLNIVNYHKNNDKSYHLVRVINLGLNLCSLFNTLDRVIKTSLFVGGSILFYCISD